MAISECLLLFFLLAVSCVVATDRPVTGQNILPCKCGDADLLVRIMGGVTAGIGEFPWQALILYSYRQHCGGTLINDRYVLTAAHCVRNFIPSLFTVVLGAYDQEKNMGTEKEFSVVGTMVHENFVSHRNNDVRDIALLRLNETIVFNTYIRPVCLVPHGVNFYNKLATITGWGRTRFDGPSSRLLEKTDVRVLSDEECLHSKLGEFVSEDPSAMMCAYATGKDSCQGDSGGPLLYTTSSGVTFQIGIVSWGEKCGLPNYPGIYTNLTTYYNWIHEHTMDAKYCRY